MYIRKIIEIKNIKFLYLIITVITIFFLSGCSNDKKMELPKAKQGVLDLRNWDFKKDGVVELNGQWEFYDKQLYTPKDFTIERNPVYNNVDRKSNYFKFNGYATYRLHIKLRSPEDILCLNFKKGYYVDYKLWINGKLASSTGNPVRIESVGNKPKTDINFRI